ncbi:MAG: integrase core domain-containing protein [Oligoflexus sp.]
MRTSPHSPWENSFIERFSLSSKTEVLNRSILKGNDYVRGFCMSCQNIYNSKRPHHRIGDAIPVIQDVHTLKSPDIENLKIKKSQVLNGLVTEFRLAA